MDNCRICYQSVESRYVFCLALILLSVARRPRRCMNGWLSDIYIHWKHQTRITILNDNISLYTTVNWTITGGNTSTLDGFLFRMKPSTGRIRSMTPFQDPQASLTKLWISTKNTSECSESDDVESQSYENAGKLMNCWCNATSCPFAQGLSCIPSTDLLKYRLGVFYAIPIDRRSVTFETKYHVSYLFEMFPYQREAMSRYSKRYNIPPTLSCANDLSKSLIISAVEANSKCCEQGFASLSAVDVQASALSMDLVTRTLNVSISWIPPVGKDYVTSEVWIHPRGNQTAIVKTGSYDVNNTCSVHSRRDSVTAYGLLPNTTYKFTIPITHSGAFYTKTIDYKTGAETSLQSCSCSSNESLNECITDSVNAKYSASRSAGVNRRKRKREEAEEMVEIQRSIKDLLAQLVENQQKFLEIFSERVGLSASST